jgi:chemotaxis signal transduction protein
VLPVIDLRKRFGLAHGERDANRIVVVAWTGPRSVGSWMLSQECCTCRMMRRAGFLCDQRDTAFITGIAKLGSSEEPAPGHPARPGKVLSWMKAGLQALPVAS